MLLCGRWYLLIDISVFCADRSALRLQSRVDILVSLVHVLSEIGRWLRLVEFERLRFCGSFGLLEGLHLCHKLLLNLTEVGYGACSRRLEVEQKIGLLLSALGLVQVFFLSPLLLILVLLHPGWELCSVEALFGIISDPLLSVVFFLFHHHLETRNQNAPGDNTGSELLQHGFVDVIGEIKTLALLCQVPFVE